MCRCPPPAREGLNRRHFNSNTLGTKNPPHVHFRVCKNIPRRALPYVSSMFVPLASDLAAMWPPECLKDNPTRSVVSGAGRPLAREWSAGGVNLRRISKALPSPMALRCQAGSGLAGLRSLWIQSKVTLSRLAGPSCKAFNISRQTVLV